MTFRKTFLLLGGLTVLSLAGVGCATKKHVREALAPVQNQANQTQSQVTTLQKQTDENKQAVGDLDRQVATTDEKAAEAGNRATEAAEAAAKANSATTEASQRADAANSLAQQTQQGVTQLGQRMDESLQNLDNYKLVATEQVYFGLNRSVMTQDEQAKLDDAVQKVAERKNYLVEVLGFTDRTGDNAYNRELSRRRADAVVHCEPRTPRMRRLEIIGRDDG